jgi:hypothetical protein
VNAISEQFIGTLGLFQEPNQSHRRRLSTEEGTSVRTEVTMVVSSEIQKMMVMMEMAEAAIDHLLIILEDGLGETAPSVFPMALVI